MERTQRRNVPSAQHGRSNLDFALVSACTSHRRPPACPETRGRTSCRDPAAGNDSRSQIPGALHRCVARHLLHPARVRMTRDAAQRYAAAAYLDEDQYVIRYQPSLSQHLHCKEVSPGEYVHVRLDELFPSRRATPLRRWRDRVPAQDVTDCLVRHLVAQGWPARPRCGRSPATSRRYQPRMVSGLAR